MIFDVLILSAALLVGSGEPQRLSTEMHVVNGDPGVDISQWADAYLQAKQEHVSEPVVLLLSGHLIHNEEIEEPQQAVQPEQSE